MGSAVHGNGKTDENAFFPDETFLGVYPHAAIYNYNIIIIMQRHRKSPKEEYKKILSERPAAAMVIAATNNTNIYIYAYL